jgi:hypothetical protein
MIGNMIQGRGFQKPQPMQKPQPTYGGEITPTDPSQGFSASASKPMGMGMGPSRGGMGAMRGNPAGDGQYGQMGSSMGFSQNKPGMGQEMITPQLPGGMMGGMVGQMGGPQVGSAAPDFSGLQGQMQNMRGMAPMNRGNPAGSQFGGYQPNARDVAQRMFASRMLGRQQTAPGGMIGMPYSPDPTM